LDSADISQVSENTVRWSTKRLEFEKGLSKTLDMIQQWYKAFNSHVQIIIDEYSNGLESASHTVMFADREKATEALRHLERETATFRREVNTLLRTVYMSDSEAMEYFYRMRSIYKHNGTMMGKNIASL
jgi:hypothetical protein